MQNSVGVSPSTQTHKEDSNMDVDSLISGLTVLEQAEPDFPSDGANVKVELVPFLENNETCITGDELAKRAKTLKATFGGRLAKVLADNQGSLENEWRRFLIVFTGLIVIDARGDKRVLGLSWNGKNWYLGLRWLDRSFGHHTRLVRIVA